MRYSINLITYSGIKREKKSTFRVIATFGMGVGGYTYSVHLSAFSRFDS
jgi:hypothetical protein